MHHVVHFSGGAASYVAAKRVIEKFGRENVTLLFADTRTEDESLYEFVAQAEKVLGMKVVIPLPQTRYQNVKDIWDVFFGERMIAKNGVGVCTKNLKRIPCDNWIKQNFPDPATVINWVGIDIWERHRLEGDKRTPGLAKKKLPYIYKSPLLEKPYLMKKDMLEIVKADGLDAPTLYEYGFEHANCGGFCVKAGHAHFRNLLKHLPERYAYHERREQEFREFIGKDVSILFDQIPDPNGALDKNGRVKKVKRILTLRDFRLREEAKNQGLLQLEFEDVGGGGCGCMIDD